MIPTLFRSLVS